MFLTSTTTGPTLKGFDHQAQKHATRVKKIAQHFKSGTGHFLDSNNLFADQRGQQVVRDQCQNRVPNKQYTVAEQMLFKRDFKRADQVWKPNNPTHSGHQSVFSKLPYVENGPQTKQKREPLKVWRCSD